MSGASKLSVWLVIANAMLGGLVLTGDAFLSLAQEEKFALPEHFGTFSGTALLWHFAYLLVSLICGIYLLHGKPSSDKNERPLIVPMLLFGILILQCL